MALLFPNSPGTGLLSRGRNWLDANPDRRDKLAALFQGWAMGSTPSESWANAGQLMGQARGEAKERREQEAAQQAFMGLLGGGGYNPTGPFPTMGDVQRVRPGLLNNTPDPFTAGAPPPPGLLNQPPPPASLGGGDDGNSPAVMPTASAPAPPAAPSPPPATTLAFAGVDGLVPGFRDPLQAFLAAAPGGGITIGSGYRTVERQQQLWDAKVAEVRRQNPGLSQAQIEEIADDRVARPGQSNHNHGGAADLQYANDEARRWAHENAAAYGLNFPMSYEDWHIELAGGGHPAVGAVNAMAGGAPRPPVTLAGGTPPSIPGVSVGGPPVDPFRGPWGPPPGSTPNPAYGGGAGAPGITPRMGQLFQILSMPGINDGQRAAVQLMIQQEMAANAPAAAPTYQSESSGNDLYSFNPQTGEYQLRVDAPETGDNSAPPMHQDANGIWRYADGPNVGQIVPGFDDARQPTPQNPVNASQLRGEVLGLPAYRKYAEARTIYGSMFDAAGRNTKAADINLVYGLAKMMDPESVVREGEQIIVRNSAGLTDQLMGWINSLNGGQELVPDTRQAVMQEAYSRMQAYESALNTHYDFYRGIVGRGNLVEDDVLPPMQPYEPWKPAAPLAPPPPAAPANTTVIPRTAAAPPPAPPVMAPPPYTAPTPAPPAPVAAPVAPTPAPAPTPSPAAPVPFAAAPPEKQAQLRAAIPALVRVGNSPERIVELLRLNFGIIATPGDLGL